MPTLISWHQKSDIISTFTHPVIRETCFYFQARKGGLVSEGSVSLLDV